MDSLRPPSRKERGSATLPFGVGRDHVEPLWDRIERNRTKVAIFLVLFVLTTGVSTALLTAIAMFLAGVALVSSASTPVFFAAIPWVSLAAMLAACLGTTVYAARMMTHAERRLLRRFGARRAEQGEAPRAKRALHEMALATGYEYPPLWVIDDCDRINAFALGLDERSAVVGVTRGFLDRLDAGDQRAVFANLMSRIRSGDALWATSVSVIMGPIWKLREQQFRNEDEGEDPLAAAGEDLPISGRDGAAGGLPLYFAVFAVAVVVTELLMAGHERAALVAAEKADSEGMLLLKDPREMLRGLEKVLEANNTVLAAGEVYSMLFYCWAGFGFAPEDDPEMERVSRLREVVGPEGMVEDPRSSYRGLTPEERSALAGAPKAPRLDGPGEETAP